ncbi:hypothetical protein BCR43DRAFT_484137 [Syncephalastrum racemosum]|uniref:Uncharacterized protein n=1 Tax=Syncephalastrum racemosum TaxID=13706 RepID=A0A1X2HWG3_SYNRA|nr:hypothetical protein BCR43DRAFT_484137 [Syncephalastrum racemosum]
MMNIKSSAREFPSASGFGEGSTLFPSSSHSCHLDGGSCQYCVDSVLDDPYSEFMVSNDITSFVDGETYHYNYLVSLFTAPDMKAFLAQASPNEDLYALPIHLQRLISEAKEEVVLEASQQGGQQQQQQSKRMPALDRLERVRSYVRMQSCGDLANLMLGLTELVWDDDELEHVLES